MSHTSIFKSSSITIFFSLKNLLIGSNLYSNLQNAGGNNEWGVAGSDGYGRVEAGALELSNVDVAREFSKLITTQRAFQANSRMVSASDEILMELLRLKR